MDSFLTALICVCIMYVKMTISAWTLSSQPLPQPDEELAVGAYNGTIFILGALGQPRQLTTYEIAIDELTDLGTSALSSDVNGGHSNYWTQQGHIIYIIDDTNPQLNIFNMITNEYTTNWNSITFTTAVGDRGCLSSSSQYLYITGGDSGSAVHNELQIMNLNSYLWSSNPPSMNQVRSRHACIYYNDYLWVFGGDDGFSSTELQSNERISTIDIATKLWNFIDSLSVPLDVFRAVALYDTIYLIGGIDDSQNERDFVHLIDANTGTVTVSLDLMPLINAWGAPIIVDAVLYVFGGFFDKNKVTADWAYYPLPTAPTFSVAPSPSKYPTAAPSFDPSIPTTSNPTSSPSKYPTENPSLYPWLNPTLNPSLYPTLTFTFDATASETLYTISITLNDCDECDIDRDKINNILIVYLSDDVQILSTEIMDNKIVITIEDHDDNTLDKDVISNGIINELEVSYGDVDVTIQETENGDETQINNKMFPNFVIVIIAVSIAFLCGAIMAGTYFLYKYLTVQKGAQKQQQMMQLAKADAGLSDIVTPVAEPGETEHNIDEIEVDEEKERDDATDDDDDDSTDSLYDVGKQDLGTLTLTEDGEINEKDADDTDLLYDADPEEGEMSVAKGSAQAVTKCGTNGVTKY